MNRQTLPTDDRITLMHRVGVAAGLALLLSGCIDEPPSASESVDQIQILKQAHIREIASTLKEAKGAFDQRNYDACAALCANVLLREPSYEPALWLSIKANTAKADTEDRSEVYSLLLDGVLKTQEGQLIPQQDTLTYPHLGLPKPKEPERVFPVAPESLSVSKVE